MEHNKMDSYQMTCPNQTCHHTHTLSKFAFYLVGHMNTKGELLCPQCSFIWNVKTIYDVFNSNYSHIHASIRNTILQNFCRKICHYVYLYRHSKSNDYEAACTLLQLNQYGCIKNYS